MFGLGKTRTPFGKWIDKKRILQIEVEDETGLSQPTVTQLCNSLDYDPGPRTRKKVLEFIRKRGEEGVTQEDLWPM